MLKYKKIKGNLVHKSAVINWNKINGTCIKKKFLGKCSRAIRTPNKEVIVYCTGGVRSAMAYFVFRFLGYEVRNYDGSWWDWSQSTFPIEANG